MEIKFMNSRIIKLFPAFMFVIALSVSARAQVLPRLDCVEINLQTGDTALAEDESAGATSIRVAGLVPNMARIVIDPGGPNQETAPFVRKGSDGALLLFRPAGTLASYSLQRSHSAGETVRFEPGDQATALFGYHNLSNTPVTVPAGLGTNQFIPAPTNRGQPSVFLPGVHHKVFFVTFPVGTDLTWLLNSLVVVARADPALYCADCSNLPPRVAPAAAQLARGTSDIVTIGTVSDDHTPAGDLIIEVTAAAVGATIAPSLVSNLANNDGVITARINLDCGFQPIQIGLRATDADGLAGDGIVTVNRLPSAAFQLAYSPQTVRAGASFTLTPTVGPLAGAFQSLSVLSIAPSGFAGWINVDASGVVSINNAAPAGNYTVTIRAMDVCGATRDISFTVRVTAFDVCLKDDSSNAQMLINTQTGEYIICCSGATITGRGTITRRGSIYTLQHNISDRRVIARIDISQMSGAASMQSLPGQTRCSITDRNTADNNCSCGG